MHHRRPSTNWYLAEGFTADESTEQLVLTNPFDQNVIVDVSFATDEGSRAPSQLQGFPVPPRSVQVIDVDSIAARDEPQVAVTVSAQRGAALLVGRAQLYDGGGRLGYSMTLASPVLRSQWWFANGLRGPGITERYSIYNPGEDDVQVQPLYLGIASDVQVSADPINVPAGELVTYSSDGVTGLPDGRHGLLFDTQDAGQALVIERAITRTIDDIPTTSVLLGGLARGEDALVPTVWTLGIGPGEPTDDALLVYNTTNAEATVTVQAVTPAGLVNVPGLEALELPGGRHPAHLARRSGRPRRPARRPGHGTGVRRAIDSPRAGCPGAQLVVGRPGGRLSRPWTASSSPRRSSWSRSWSP